MSLQGKINTRDWRTTSREGTRVKKVMETKLLRVCVFFHLCKDQALVKSSRYSYNPTKFTADIVIFFHSPDEHTYTLANTYKWERLLRQTEIKKSKMKEERKSWVLMLKHAGRHVYIGLVFALCSALCLSVSHLFSASSNEDVAL